MRIRISGSGEMSAKSISASKAASSLLAFCIRSAYSRKWRRASDRKPFAAPIFPNLR